MASKEAYNIDKDNMILETVDFELCWMYNRWLWQLVTS
jgi:hypothetical protein